MFSFFKKSKNKINVYSITIPDFGWNVVDERSTIIVYVKPDQTASVSVNFFEKKPDLPTTKDIDYLRNFYRNLIAPANGGLIEVSLLNIQGIAAVKTIFKIKQEMGMAYLASITIPFENFSFVVKLQAIEVGITGMREAMVANKLLENGEITVGDTGFTNWFSDPYDATITIGTLMNKSEFEHYDPDYPEHPLSIVRQAIDKIIMEIQFTNEVLNSSAFRK